MNGGGVRRIIVVSDGKKEAPMRSILVHADNDSAFEGRLQVALDLARRFEGHATLLIATPLQQFVSFDPFGGTYFAAEALAAAQADDLALESRLAEDRKSTRLNSSH